MKRVPVAPRFPAKAAWVLCFCVLGASAGPAWGGPWFVVSGADAQSPAARAVLRDANRDRYASCRARALVHTEGTLPHQGIYDESREALRDFPELRDLGLAWRLSGDPAYFRAAAAWLDAWSRLYRPSFNPIDETGFDGFIMAYAVLEPGLPGAENARCRALLRAWAQGYPAGRGRRRARGAVTSNNNNWESHRVKIATLSAAALGDAALMDRCEAMYRRQLAQNLRPNGEPVDFGERDALHYVVYDLEPLVQAALAARTQGRDWYDLKNPRGAGLALALAWLEPYADGSRTHEEFVHSRVPFDARRAQAGVKGFSGPWDPATAADLYALAARLDPRWRDLAARLAEQRRSQAWIALLPGPALGGSHDRH